MPRRLRTVWIEELASLPPPTWLIDAILPSQGLVALCGEPGQGKTFIALDIALSVAAGRPWCGRKVQQGEVAYVIAEGAQGLGIRVRSWQQVKGELRERSVLGISEPIQPHREGEIESLIEEIRMNGLKPRLIIIDTFARCFAGADENSAKDMGVWVNAISRLQREFDATIVFLHHPTKSNGDLRGSGALAGAADTIISVDKNRDGLIDARCEKQKDAEPFERFQVRLRSVEGTNSAIVEAIDACLGISPPSQSPNRLLDVLRRHPEGLRATEWQSLSGLPQSSFYRQVQALVKQGLLVSPKKGFYVLAADSSQVSARLH